MRLVRALKAEGVQVDDLRNQANQDKGDAEQAGKAEGQANSNDEKAQSELRSAQATQKAAATCAKGALLALNELLNASDPNQGAEKAGETLDAAQPACDSASGD